MTKLLFSYSGICLIFSLIIKLFFGEHYSLYSLINLTLSCLFFVAGSFCVFKEKSFLPFRSFKVKSFSVLYSSLFVGIVSLLNFILYHQDPLYFDGSKENVFSLSQASSRALSGFKNKVHFKLLGERAQFSREFLLNIRRFSDSSKNVEIEFLSLHKSPFLYDRYHLTQGQALVLELDSKRYLTLQGEPSEEQITEALFRLGELKRKKIYYLIGHGELPIDAESQQLPNSLSSFTSVLSQNQVETYKLALSDIGSIPTDADAIFIAAPRSDFLENESSAIEAYLKNGGRAFIVSEPNSSAALRELLSHFSISLGSDVVVDESKNTDTAPQMGLSLMVTAFGRHKITEGLDQAIVLETASSVLPASRGIANFVELAYSGQKSWAEKTLEKIFSDKPMAWPDADDIKGPVSLGLAYHGENDSKILVIGDSDFITNRSLGKLFNQEFAIRCLNWLLYEDVKLDFVDKKMAQTVRPITVSEYQGALLFAVVLIPQFFLISVFYVWWKRGRES